MRRPDIRFDLELNRGIASYSDKVGRWWYRQASNPIHAYAYRNIARFIHSSSERSPRMIVDYACGCGNLLSRLSLLFPDAHLMGLDGSALMLKLARKRLAQRGHPNGDRLSLVETHLPNFDLPNSLADMVVFAFPNIVPSKEPAEQIAEHRFAAGDLKVARKLAQACYEEYGDASDEPDVVYADLLRDRLVSLNMRRLLKRGGICFRVEYGNTRRELLPEVELLRTGVEEGSLDIPVDGTRTAQWFRILASRYFRSGVMEDVYHQSGDVRDRTGGYFITVLRAI